MGGVETEDEYNISKQQLIAWLNGLAASEHTSPEVKYNAKILQDHFELRIKHHKSRWLLAGRGSRLTLDQKTTSTLEGVNHTIKCKSTKVVTPNMTLLTSFQTQCDQVKSRLCSWFQSALNAFHHHPLSGQGDPPQHHL